MWENRPTPITIRFRKRTAGVGVTRSNACCRGSWGNSARGVVSSSKNDIVPLSVPPSRNTTLYYVPFSPSSFATETWAFAVSSAVSATIAASATTVLREVAADVGYSSSSSSISTSTVTTTSRISATVGSNLPFFAAPWPPPAAKICSSSP